MHGAKVKNNRYFTWRPVHYDHISLSSP